MVISVPPGWPADQPHQPFDAGHRSAAFPDFIVPDLTSHLAQFTAPEADALVFTSPTGTPPPHSNFRRRAWAKATSRPPAPSQ
jgi:hypothetical protein